MKNLSKIATYRLMQLLGETCLICNAHEFTSSGLCEQCINDLPWQAPGCRYCGILMPEDSCADPVCARCRSRPPSFDSCVCLLGYESEISGKILAIKDFSDFRAARILGQHLAQIFVAHYRTENKPMPELLLPVPLHASRMRRRGYNQAIELARIIAVRTGLPIVTDACLRRNTGHSQRGLNATERQANAGKMFECGDGLSKVHHKRIAIIDDVVTTTTTIADMSGLIKSGGAVSVEVWALARRN
jgi:ComF family protein